MRIIYHSLALALLIGLSSAGIAAAQAGSDVCVGVSANIGGTCMPLINTTSGDSGNVAIGGSALFNNTTGADNVGAGSGALFNNTTGGANTAAGSFALEDNTTGSNNVGIGQDGGFDLTTGDNNIDIGNSGVGAE